MDEFDFDGCSDYFYYFENMYGKLKLCKNCNIRPKIKVNRNNRIYASPIDYSIESIIVKCIECENSIVDYSREVSMAVKEWNKHN